MNQQTAVNEPIADLYNGGMPPIPSYSNVSELCAQIEQMRKQLGMTQLDVIEELGVSERGYRYWIEGKRTPTGVAYKALTRLHEDLLKRIKRSKLPDTPLES